MRFFVDTSSVCGSFAKSFIDVSLQLNDTFSRIELSFTVEKSKLFRAFEDGSLTIKSLEMIYLKKYLRLALHTLFLFTH